MQTIFPERKISAIGKLYSAVEKRTSYVDFYCNEETFIDAVGDAECQELLFRSFQGHPATVARNKENFVVALWSVGLARFFSRPVTLKEAHLLLKEEADASAPPPLR